MENGGRSATAVRPNRGRTTRSAAAVSKTAQT